MISIISIISIFIIIIISIISILSILSIIIIIISIIIPEAGAIEPLVHLLTDEAVGRAPWIGFRVWGLGFRV